MPPSFPDKPKNGGTQGTLATEALADYRGFLGLRTAWNALVEGAERPSVFLRHEWLDAAWHWQPDGAVPLILVFRDDAGEPVGIAPCSLQPRQDRLGRHTALTFLAVPDTQLCELITGPSHYAVVARSLLRWLKDNRRLWDVLDLGLLPADSPLPEALSDGTDGLPVGAGSHGANSYIELDGDWEGYYRRRTRRWKKAQNHVTNRLRRTGPLAVSWLRTPAEAPRALAEAIDVSARSWKGSTGNSLDAPGPQAFIRRLTELAAANGWLSVWVLYLEGRPIAVEYQLRYGSSFHALRADYDGELADLSPGSYLNRLLLEGLFRTVRGRYYLGPGDNAYKLRWSDLGEPLVRAQAPGLTLRGRSRRLLHRGIRPMADRLRRRLPAAADKGKG